MRKTFTLLGLAAILTGCAGFNEALTKYGDTAPVPYRIDGSTWRIFDQPENGRLMITPGIGAAGAAGAKQGLTFGMAGYEYVQSETFTPPTTAYLAQRDCKITGGHLVVPTQYEFEYAC